jgi:hypothetical protein
MAEQADSTGYKIWAVDDVVYGPVDLPTLTAWVQDERVLADTWIYRLEQQAWQRAGQTPELQALLGTPATDPAAPKTPAAPLRVKIFATMTDQQLGRFVQLMEVAKVPTFHEICRQGQPGDAMYCVLEGEVRARLIVGGRETTLATFQAGDIFGEICLFDDGPRSADVLANRDSVLLRISAAKFDRLAQDAPDLATPLLLALGRTLTARIRNDNRRLGELVTLSRAAQ